MRLEVEVVLFFPEKPMKRINGFLNVSQDDTEDEIMENMVDFISIVSEEYENEFSTGIANVMIDEDEMFHLSFSNPKNAKMDGKELCNIIMPDEMTIH
jgi:hypothetical protein